MTNHIDFFTEDTDYVVSEKSLRLWITEILTQEYDYQSYQINYIFCSDDYLHTINVDYLNHDTYTDIITFPLEVTDHHISSDIFISIPRVRENAKQYLQSEQDELLRVMAHGLLHLFGLDDKTDDDKALMRKAESKLIQLYYTL